MVWSKVRHRDEPGWPVADVAGVVQDVAGPFMTWPTSFLA